ncbi:gamma-glutamyltransferase [Candidatus Paraluminiphilus aquimaris]|uniref:Glutathione hydrolase proenzyme n=1 Tax=Candidatus Paraluminiphilus aquimaris TaxID=2518994 RepID=A0ABY6Q6Y8_9GAMM|nr:gamma-glutamyltransferase [Candidatus Paraluminiphilus aquimaris]UZP74011.1 gamma-glutamyltransferase [Candidatus Paraluminiphilus aquimaris]
MRLTRLFLAFLIITSPMRSLAQSESQGGPLIDYGTRFIPAIASRGMVSGPEKLASEAGLAMLKKGGNAIDAAVATSFALAVTLPRAGNIAGGGFMLVHLADANEQVFIDYREMAPAAASRDMFLNEDGTVNKRKAYNSVSAAGIPGTVAGLIHALEQYGTLDLKTVMQPAIDLAENGFAVPAALHLNLRSAAKRLGRNEEANRVYLGGTGTAPAMGTLFKQPDLAATLKRVRDKGFDGFYKGKTAALIAAEMQRGGGVMNADDLASYRAIERKPVRASFRGYDIVSAPPPSSGGVHVSQILKLLEPYPIEDMGHNSAAYLHLLIESMKLAYADRSEYLGDPDRTTIPIATLTSEPYLEKRRELIKDDEATPSEIIKPGDVDDYESTETTHFSVVDQFGNVVTNTYTINFSFGSGIVVPGTGMLLNNEMDDFAAKPGFPNGYGLVQGEANAVSAGSRPLSSMTPTLVFKEGKPWVATGSPGGSRIITAVTQTLLNLMAFDMTLGMATSSPRIHHQWMPDMAMVEPGISEDTIRILEKSKHKILRSNSTIGRVNSVQIEDGWFYGYADPRRPGGHVATW